MHNTSGHRSVHNISQGLQSEETWITVEKMTGGKPQSGDEDQYSETNQK